MDKFHHLRLAPASIETHEDLRVYFRLAIQLRFANREQSAQIARCVFNQTHRSRLTFTLTEKESRIRDEFGALEAPGSFCTKDENLQKAREDELWRRLEDLL